MKKHPVALAQSARVAIYFEVIPVDAWRFSVAVRMAVC
jgi:hypothetical protein